MVVRIWPWLLSLSALHGAVAGCREANAPTASAHAGGSDTASRSEPVQTASAEVDSAGAETPSLPDTVTVTTSEFANDDCKATATCSLKGARVEVFDSVSPSGRREHTRMVASYETLALSELENYLWVQFIRGCAFESRREADGTVSRRPHQMIEHFGRYVIFQFPEWTIDSSDMDPMYQSNKKQRHASYLLTSDTGNPAWFGQRWPESPVLYISDSPSAADETVYATGNVSLEFSLCLFRSADVPTGWTGDTRREIFLKSALPIHCFEWRSSHVFNHDTGTFEHPAEIAPVCLN